MRVCYLLLLAILLCRTLPLSAQNPAEMDWDALIEQGDKLVSAGKNAEALPYFQAAMTIARRDSSETSAAYGTTLDYLGYTLHHLGHLADAERTLTAGVQHARLNSGENHEDYMTRLSNLAMLHKDMGKYPQAVSELETAVRLARKNLKADNPYLPIMVNNLGLLFEVSGDLDHALDQYFDALKMTELTVGKETARYAIRLNNIASIYRRQRKVEKSQVYALEALSIIEKTVGKSHPLYALGLSSVTANYRMMGLQKEATLRTEELRLALENPLVRQTMEAYDYVCTISNQYLYNREWDRCIEYSRAELLRYRELYPKQFYRQNYLTSIIINALEQSGRLNEAADYALEQSRATLQEFREKYSEFSEKEQAQLFDYSAMGYMTPYLFSIRHPEFTELAGAAFDYLMTIKGMSMANRRQLFKSLRAHPDAGIAAQFEEWQQLQNNISKEYALPPARRQTNLDSLVARSNELERNLAIGSEAFRMASKETHWRDVRAALSPGEAAIEFGQFRNRQNDSTFYAAWLIRPNDDQPRQVYLFEEREIGALSATRRLYGTEEVPASGKNLQTLVWKPLEPLLAGITTLYYAPAGMLHQVNLGAIPLSSSETLADRFLLHRLISTRQIISDKNTRDVALPATALVFGGIRYESDSLALASTNRLVEEDQDALAGKNRGAMNGSDWEYLSGSYQEAVSVRNRLSAAGARVVFADGFQASEGYFKKSVQSAPALLHLATHGFFIASTDSSARMGFASAENPMARAGLALSGANRVWTGNPAFEGQEDGILTAMEISRLDLEGTQLAVLSACGTGQGKIETGEGVFGLQRALKMAGVRYVIMTLWNVQDAHAQQFMDIFYEAWLQRKLPVPEAFRMAQHQMREKYSKPFQPMAWAGFLLLE